MRLPGNAEKDCQPGLIHFVTAEYNNIITAA
jgi:hypothetical protein